MPKRYTYRASLGQPLSGTNLNFYLFVVITSHSFFYFLFICVARQGDRHSFPTRRSSDLAPPPSGRPAARSRAGRRDRGGARSEEHTSELQSREKLVCRLLLEKKKMNTKSLYYVAMHKRKV